MATRTITVFLGSSEELINDRNSFHSLIASLDDIYEPRGIRVKLKRWEDFLAYCTGTRTQDDYNRVLTACDICVCMFHRKAGKFTIEEFEKSMEAYQRTQSPKTYVYARALVEGEVEEEELKQFKEELFKQMGHYWCNYATEDSMKLHFVMQFEHLLNGDTVQSNLKVDGGSVMLHGRKIAEYANLPFASDNSEMRILIDKIASLDKEVAEYRAMNIESLRPTINAKLTERNECQKQLDQLKEQLLDMALTISKIISSGNPIGERKRMAIEMFETGNNKGILDVLNEADIASEHERAKAELAYGKQLVKTGEEMIAAAEQKIRSLVEELIMKAKTWMSTFSEPNRFEEACKCYERAIQYTRESLPDEDLADRLLKYGIFLHENNQYDRLEAYYQEALTLYEQLATSAPGTYELYVGCSLQALALWHYNMQRFGESEEYYLRALDIHERLAAEHSEMHERNLGSNLNDLALLYNSTLQFEEAEAHYLRALDIFERLDAAYPEMYAEELGNIFINLAMLYFSSQRFGESEEYYLRALSLYERLAAAHPELYEAPLGKTLSNLAYLYSNMRRVSEAEEYFLRALAIYERLAAAYPEMHEWQLGIILSNFALFYTNTLHYKKAEKYHLRALEIRERLAAAYPEVHESSLADSLNNLGLLYCQKKHFKKAEEYYLRTLEIRERLAEHSEMHESQLGMILNNLALLYHQKKRFEDAEAYYLRSISVFERLAAAHPEAYENNVATTSRNLAIFYYTKNRISEALEYCSRALDIFESLAAEQPEMYSPILNTTKRNHEMFKRLCESGNTTQSFGGKVKSIFKR